MFRYNVLIIETLLICTLFTLVKSEWQIIKCELFPIDFAQRMPKDLIDITTLKPNIAPGEYWCMRSQEYRLFSDGSKITISKPLNELGADIKLSKFIKLSTSSFIIFMHTNKIEIPLNPNEYSVTNLMLSCYFWAVRVREQIYHLLVDKIDKVKNICLSDTSDSDKIARAKVVLIDDITTKRTQELSNQCLTTVELPKIFPMTGYSPYKQLGSITSNLIEIYKQLANKDSLMTYKLYQPEVFIKTKNDNQILHTINLVPFMVDKEFVDGAKKLITEYSIILKSIEDKLSTTKRQQCCDNFPCSTHEK